jgi:hypothetical protein
MSERWQAAARRLVRGRAFWGAAALCLAAVSALAGQGRQTPPGPGGGTPAPTQPAQPGQPTQPGTTVAAAPAVVPRTFTGTTGLMFNTVRPERVADFELLLAEVQQALARSTNPATQAQAKGWRFFKAAEPGPNGTVMFVFVVDPVVPGEDYSLGKILVDAFPDVAKVQEVWKLYTTSVTGGGTLLNLSAVSATPAGRGRGAGPAAPAPAGAPTEPAQAAPGTTPAPAPGLPDVPRTLPPDRDPARDPAR